MQVLNIHSKQPWYGTATPSNMNLFSFSIINIFFKINFQLKLQIPWITLSSSQIIITEMKMNKKYKNVQLIWIFHFIYNKNTAEKKKIHNLIVYLSVALWKLSARKEKKEEEMHKMKIQSHWIIYSFIINFYRLWTDINDYSIPKNKRKHIFSKVIMITKSERGSAKASTATATTK